MTNKIVPTAEIWPSNGHVEGARTQADIENLLASVTGLFFDGKLYATPMRTFGHRVLLGSQGGDGSYTDEQRPGLRAVIPSEGHDGADVVVLRENDVLCFKVTDIFSGNPRVRESEREAYDRRGKNPEPFWIQPNNVVRKLHLIDATRTSEHGLLQLADNQLQERMSRLGPVMTPDHFKKLQLPAIALQAVSADLARRGVAAA